jgi:hypothetical protein
MPLQKKLIQSIESGPWNSNNSQINFNIPPNMNMIDMSKSSIVLDVVVTVKATGANLGLYDVQFKNQCDARCLINSLKITTNKGGLVEEIQNLNVLTQNLLLYNKSTELLKSQSWLGQGQTFSNYGPFLTRYETGSTTSIQQCSIPIPFKSVCGVGNQSQWLNGNVDGTNVQVNLEYYDSTVAGLFQQILLLNIPATSTAVSDGDTSVNLLQTAKANNQTAIPWYVGEPIAITFAPTWTPSTITAATQANPCVITLAQSPSDIFVAVGNRVLMAGFTGNWAPLNNAGGFVVGAIDDNARTVTLTGTDSSAYGAIAGAGTAVRLAAERTDQVSNSTITSIAIAADNQITISSTWNRYYGGAPSSISALGSGINDNALSYKINNAQLALVQNVPLPSQQSAMLSRLSKNLQIPFFSWAVERVNLPTVGASMKYVKLIDLLPNCRQVIIMVPLPASGDPLGSVDDNQENYRFSVDTVYTTSRAIVTTDALYYDTLINGFVNCKQSLNCLNGPVIWCQSIPVDGMSHQLQYEYTQNSNAGTANKIMYVFQCIDKVFNTDSGIVMNA